MNRKHLTQSGMVLPLTLIIVAMLTMMASLLLSKGNELVEDARNTKEQWRAELEINNAEQRLFMAIMAGNESPGAYALGNTQIRIDGTPMKLSNDVWVSVQDQSGILSLRFLRKGLLLKLFHSYSNGHDLLASQLFNEIVSFQSSKILSEDGELSSGFPRREAVFRSLDELMLIPGISSEMFNGEYELDQERDSEHEKNELVPGLKESVAISGSSYINFSAMPEAILRRVLDMSEFDIDTINEMKARGNWDAVTKKFVDSGWPEAAASFIPSPFYTIRFEYKGIRARGDYLIRTTTFPPHRRAWYFPDNERYFINSNRDIEFNRD
jgi:hypothetical protein